MHRWSWKWVPCTVWIYIVLIRRLMSDAKSILTSTSWTRISSFSIVFHLKSYGQGSFRWPTKSVPDQNQGKGEFNKESA